MEGGHAMKLEDRIKKLLVRFAADGPERPRLVLRQEGVYVTENGTTTLVSWEEWDAAQDAEVAK